jgi:hypothetical protein
MAYLVRRSGDRFDLREASATPAGPRSRTLATFRAPLTPEILERAAARATRPFDRAVILARAAQLGVVTTERREDRAAREVLALLRAGAKVDPVLVTLLRDALAQAESAPVPERLAEVAEWVGVPVERRGAAVRDLLRLSDRIVAARGPVRSRPRGAYPRFSSRRGKRRAVAARAR